MPGKHYKLGGAIKRRAEQMRNNPANPTFKRMKTKDASGKTKTGGILGQNKEKRTVSNPFGRDKSATVKTKKEVWTHGRNDKKRHWKVKDRNEKERRGCQGKGEGPLKWEWAVEGESRKELQEGR